jgi:hypothetical protein
VVIALFVTLGGCASAPFVDSRREAGRQIMVGPSNEDVVAICHGGGEPPPDAVQLAQAACAKTERVPRLEQRVRFACTLLAPTRTFFRCVPAGTGG